MSARACIARPVGDGWEGVSNHYDGQPTGLGIVLLNIYDTSSAADPAADMIATLIDAHPHGWVRAGEECNCDTHPSQAAAQRYHCTCPLPTTECQPLHIEWAYVIAGTGLFVYRAVDVSGLDIAAYASAMAAGELVNGGYTHELAGHVAWGDYAAMRALEVSDQ
ncbi:MAG TPA: hypothetical protein VHD87_15205 [Acidimicrobiales bacterium]|nr:hypothetical protein [Acidimicrobiales bacterium]